MFCFTIFVSLQSSGKVLVWGRLYGVVGVCKVRFVLNSASVMVVVLGLGYIFDNLQRILLIKNFHRMTTVFAKMYVIVSPIKPPCHLAGGQPICF